MRLNDKEIKLMYTRVDDIHTRTKVIETKLSAIEEHLKRINGTVLDHANKITAIEVEQEAIKARLWVLVFIGGIVGGLLGALIKAVI